MVDERQALPDDIPRGEKVELREPQNIKESTQTFSRRLFLKAAVASTAAAAIELVADKVGIAQAQIPQEDKDVMPSLNNQRKDAAKEKELKKVNFPITQIDIAPSYPVGEFKQKDFISNEELVKKLLANNPKKDDPETQEVVDHFINRYFQHGEYVGNVMIERWEKEGYRNGGIDIIPLQLTFDERSFNLLGNDSIGNPQFSMYISAQKLIDLLRDDPNLIVNMSFQIGTVNAKVTKYELGHTSEQQDAVDKQFYEQFPQDPNVRNLSYVDKNGESLNFPDTYLQNSDPDHHVYKDKQGNYINPMTDLEAQDYSVKKENKKLQFEQTALAALPKVVVPNETPDFVITGAYSKENAEQNLPELFKVCAAYPNKMFVVAAGNEGEDIRFAMEKLGYIKPKNLLIVGQWGKDGFTDRNVPAWDTYGADIYVDNTQYDLKEGSSFSTPFISSYLSLLNEKGLTIDEAKQRVISACETRTFTDKDGNEQTAKVFNPDLLGDLKAI